MISFNEIELSVIVAVFTAAISLAGFSVSRRKDKTLEIAHQTIIDESLKNIQNTLNEIKKDIKEIKEKTSNHDTRIHVLETLTNSLQKQVEGLAKLLKKN